MLRRTRVIRDGPDEDRQIIGNVGCIRGEGSSAATCGASNQSHDHNNNRREKNLSIAILSFSFVSRKEPVYRLVRARERKKRYRGGFFVRNVTKSLYGRKGDETEQGLERTAEVITREINRPDHQEMGLKRDKIFQLRSPRVSITFTDKHSTPHPTPRAGGRDADRRAWRAARPARPDQSRYVNPPLPAHRSPSESATFPRGRNFPWAFSRPARPPARDSARRVRRPRKSPGKRKTPERKWRPRSRQKSLNRRP